MKPITAEQIEAARLKLYGVLLQHVGPEKKIGMGELYQAVFDRSWHHRINDTRKLRDLITEMRDDGQPVMSNSSSSGGGYWIAASGSELNAYCDKGKRKAVGMLARIAKMKRVSLPEYLGQLQLELGGGDE